MRVLAAPLLAMLLASACNPTAEKNNAAVATDEARAERSAEAPAAGANSFTEEQARGRLAENGYMNPTGLTQGEDGIWRGQATKGSATVNVGVDYQGNITTQ